MFGVGIFVKGEAAEIWPTNSYVEVKAYIFNLESQMDVQFLNGTNLNSNVFNAQGVRLHQSQLKELLKAVTGKPPEHMVALCYNPPHAFVFFIPLASRCHPLKYVLSVLIIVGSHSEIQTNTIMQT
jgi:hypothetical protein